MLVINRNMKKRKKEKCRKTFVKSYLSLLSLLEEAPRRLLSRSRSLPPRAAPEAFSSFSFLSLSLSLLSVVEEISLALESIFLKILFFQDIFQGNLHVFIQFLCVFNSFLSENSRNKIFCCRRQAFLIYNVDGGAV